MKKILDKNEETVFYLNNPISKDDQDRIGMTIYVNHLVDLINSDAKTIAITSDFGTGKSSIISLAEKKMQKNFWWDILGWFKPKFCRVNLWSLFTEDDKNPIELHKSFLFQTISQLSYSKSDFISKRLNKSYGLLKLSTGSILTKLLTCGAMVLFGFSFLLQREEELVVSTCSKIVGHEDSIVMIGYLLAGLLIFLLLINVDIVFSSKRSEGNREIDENIIMSLYRRYVLRKRVLQKKIIVLEDLDRGDKGEVINFLRELQKYYMQPFFNRVTIIVNLKPEGILHPVSDDDIYQKCFEYIINLNRINIDNYDAILEGLLIEKEKQLKKYGIVVYDKDKKISIPGIQWIIHGKRLELRVVKNRLNQMFLLFINGKQKFGDDIRIETCAAVAYLASEYPVEYSQMKDSFIDTFIDNVIGKNIENLNKLEAEFLVENDDEIKINHEFFDDLKNMIQTKIIDSSYRMYFYNYPEKSSYYSKEQLYVVNSIIYNEDDYDSLNKNVKNVNDEIIENAINKVLGLGRDLPKLIFYCEKILCICLKKYWKEFKDVFVKEFDDTIGEFKPSEIIRLLHYDKERNYYDENKVNELIDILNESATEDEMIEIRKCLTNEFLHEIGWYKKLFMGDFKVISYEELDNLHNYKKWIDFVNVDSPSFSIEIAKNIHNRIIEHKELDMKNYYLALSSKFSEVLTVSMLVQYEREVDHETDEELLQTTIEQIVQTFYKDKFDTGILAELYKQEFYFNYLVNTTKINKELLLDEKIKEYILDNYAEVRPECETWTLIRNTILGDSLLINTYCVLFKNKQDFISNEELNRVLDISDVLKILWGSEISEKNICYVAECFNKNYLKHTLSKRVFDYILSIKDLKVAELLFYSIDFDKIRYRKINREDRNSLNLQFKDKFCITTVEKMFKFMSATRMVIPDYESFIIENLHEDVTYADQYIALIKSVDSNSLSKTTLKNLGNWVKLAGTVPVLTDSLNEQCYKNGYYELYVSSKIRLKKVFWFNEEEKNKLWETFVSIFNGGKNSYATTRGYMIKNNAFTKELINEKAYVGLVFNAVIAYAPTYQTKELVQYIFSNYTEAEVKEYFIHTNCNKGFVDRDAATAYIDGIRESDFLKMDDDLYNKVYNMLVDGGLKRRYTNMRKTI